MPHLISRKAPVFTTQAVMADNSIENNFDLSDYKGKYIVLFFYPLDFTFVCPTEIIAFNENIDEFRKRDTEVFGISVDSVYSHLAWKKTEIEDGGIGSIQFPLLADINHTIGNAYDVMLNDEITFRALFIIDREGIVRHATLNDNSLGRSIDETLRVLDAVRHFDEHGRVCPANWTKDKESISPSKEGIIDYLSKFSKK